jgi:Ca-activated chloride channel family protein
VPDASVDPLKYQKPATPSSAADSGELMTVKLRYKAPEGDTSRLVTQTVQAAQTDAPPSRDFQWASAVAGFGMLLRDSPHMGDVNWDRVITMATRAVGPDTTGQRMEMVVLAKQARDLAKSGDAQAP